MSHPSRRVRWELAAGPGFSPKDVPEIAAGYFWEAIAASGIGTAAFKVPEGGGHTSFDLLQATVASQPTVLTENGGVQFRMRKAADSNPSKILMAAGAAAGWTGDTYVAGWFRMPDASGDMTGSGTLFSHSTSTGNQRRILIINSAGTPDTHFCQTFSNGAGGAGNFASSTFANQFASAGWLWLEFFVRVGVSHEFDAGLSLVTPVSTATPQATLADSAAFIDIACRADQNLANVDTMDWAACYYGNGIPSRANRVRLANHRNPTGVLLT